MWHFSSLLFNLSLKCLRHCLYSRLDKVIRYVKWKSPILSDAEQEWNEEVQKMLNSLKNLKRNMAKVILYFFRLYTVNILTGINGCQYFFLFFYCHLPSCVAYPWSMHHRNLIMFWKTGMVEGRLNFWKIIEWGTSTFACYALQSIKDVSNVTIEKNMQARHWVSARSKLQESWFSSKWRYQSESVMSCISISKCNDKSKV